MEVSILVVIVCPDDYKDNCFNLDSLCHDCLANGCGKFLRYKPLLPSSPAKQDHPCLQKKAARKKDKSYVNYSRQGRGIERMILGSKFYLTMSYASGTVGSDGDAGFNLPHFNGIIDKRVEHKTRFNKKNIYSPTKSELAKGRNQNIGTYFITTKTSNGIYYTRVFVEQVIFNQIFSYMCILHAKLSANSIPYQRGLELKRHKSPFGFVFATYSEITINSLGALKLHQDKLKKTDYIFVKYNGSIFLSCSLEAFETLITQITA